MSCVICFHFAHYNTKSYENSQSFQPVIADYFDAKVMDVMDPYLTLCRTPNQKSLSIGAPRSLAFTLVLELALNLDQFTFFKYAECLKMNSFLVS